MLSRCRTFKVPAHGVARGLGSTGRHRFIDFAMLVKHPLESLSRAHQRKSVQIM